MSTIEWANRACIDVEPDEFFRGEDEHWRAAQERLRGLAGRYCLPCPVRAVCRDAAPHGDAWGMWGGLLRRQRRGGAVVVVDLMESLCGTRNGYLRHRGCREKACGPCKAANAAYRRANFSRPNRDRNRNYQRAMRAANKRLRDLYPQEWQRLYEDEMAKISGPVLAPNNDQGVA